MRPAAPRRLGHCLPKRGFAQNFTAEQQSAWQVQDPDWQARGVGQSAIIRKQVGAKVFGERHVHRVSEGDVGP